MNGGPRAAGADRDLAICGQKHDGTLVGLFGALALLLATVGLYGIMEHAAAQRRARSESALRSGRHQDRSSA